MFDDHPMLSARLALRLTDFAHPEDVVVSDLAPDEKRQILAYWASDANVPHSRPALRWLPGTPGPVPVTSVLKALGALDKEAEADGVLAAFSGIDRRLRDLSPGGHTR